MCVSLFASWRLVNVSAIGECDKCRLFRWKSIADDRCAAGFGVRALESVRRNASRFVSQREWPLSRSMKMESNTLAATAPVATAAALDAVTAL